jgi:hypothetical protein
VVADLLKMFAAATKKSLCRPQIVFEVRLVVVENVGRRDPLQVRAQVVEEGPHVFRTDLGPAPHDVGRPPDLDPVGPSLLELADPDLSWPVILPPSVNPKSFMFCLKYYWY